MRQFKLAEHFEAPQGEGTWMGVNMMFLRLAGCPVGKMQLPEDFPNAKVSIRTENMSFEHGLLQVLQTQPGHTICRSAVEGSKPFICDTNYTPRKTYTIDELCTLTYGFRHVCLTGGEPIRPGIEELMVALVRRNTDQTIHVETSGTVLFPDLHHNFYQQYLWITCSPKAGYLPQNTQFVDTFKFVVGTEEDGPSIAKFLRENDISHQNKEIWLQPEAVGDDVSQQSYKNVLAVQEFLGSIRIQARAGLQLHKAYGTR